MNSKQLLIAIIILVLVALVGFLLTQSSTTDVNTPVDDRPIPVEPDGGIGDGAEPLDEMIDDESEETIEEGEVVIGESANGTDIDAYRFGTGDTHVLFVGGVHGNHSPNTAALAGELVEYLEDNPDTVPEGVRVSVIPRLNPDGLEDTNAATRRFNGNGVDLNRNFDCNWSDTAEVNDISVNPGSEAFSEAEARALRDYVQSENVDAAVVWFAAEGKVYPASCSDSPSKEAVTLAATYATAAGYPADAEYDYYNINGDLTNWMAKEGIPAISVLLSNHEATEWSKNKAGIEAVLASYAD